MTDPSAETAYAMLPTAPFIAPNPTVPVAAVQTNPWGGYDADAPTTVFPSPEIAFGSHHKLPGSGSIGTNRGGDDSACTTLNSNPAITQIESLCIVRIK